jgi:hypothetical protein
VAPQSAQLRFGLLKGGRERFGLTSRYPHRKLRPDPLTVDDERLQAPTTGDIAPLQFGVKDGVFAFASRLLGLIGTPLSVRSEGCNVRLDLTAVLLRLIPLIDGLKQFVFGSQAPGRILSRRSRFPIRFPKKRIVVSK